MMFYYFCLWQTKTTIFLPCSVVVGDLSRRSIVSKHIEVIPEGDELLGEDGTFDDKKLDDCTSVTSSSPTRKKKKKKKKYIDFFSCLI